MKLVRLHLTTVGLLLCTLSLTTPLLAQTVRVNILGTAFAPEGRAKAAIDRVSGGLRVRGQASALVTLRATLQMPSTTAADPKLRRLVIHFRSSPNGPSLRSVELHGSNVEVRLPTDLRGDYTIREISTPKEAANAWDWGKAPITVSAQTVIRLEVQFPGGFDSAVNPGEFFLTTVAVDFPRKVMVRSNTTTIVGTSQSKLTESSPRPLLQPSAPAGRSSGVIYAVTSNGDLLWYRHDGRDDGASRWAAGAQGKKVGSRWDIQQVFSGGDGVIYAEMSNGDLLWNRHEGRGDGSFRWAAPSGKKVGTGWNFEHVFSGGGGVIYAITADGDLLWFRHDGRKDGSFRWAGEAGKKVGEGWNFKQVFSGGDGVIYAVTADNHLLWFRHDGVDDGSFSWSASEGKIVGNGWNFEHVFSGGDGVIYAVTADGDLLWFRHAGHGDGSFRWTPPSGNKVGSGWTFAHVF